MSKALEKFMQWVKENHAQQPSLTAELKAIGREAIKDVRGTIHAAMWGQPEHMNEPGTPLNPTPQIITADLKNKEIDLEH
jgi:hypothetical protein